MPSPQEAKAWAARASAEHLIEARIADHGLLLDARGSRPPVGWELLALDLPDVEESRAGAEAVAAWTRLLTLIDQIHPDVIADLVRVLGMPSGHPLHPGPNWVRQRVHGGSLDLGLGLSGTDPDRPDVPGAVPSGIWEAAGLDPSRWWGRARLLHERMGEAAGLRYAEGETRGRLRPMGGHDVVTLLGARSYRQVLADRGDLGLIGVAVPVREDGWIAVTMVDSAFASVASGVAEEQSLGFARPVLVTADEVVEPPAGGSPELALGATGAYRR